MTVGITLDHLSAGYRGSNYEKDTYLFTYYVLSRLSKSEYLWNLHYYSFICFQVDDTWDQFESQRRILVLGKPYDLSGVVCRCWLLWTSEGNNGKHHGSNRWGEYPHFLFRVVLTRSLGRSTGVILKCFVGMR